MEMKFRKYLILGVEDPKLEDVLSIYKSNRHYFNLCGTENISLATVEEDLEAFPEGVDEENKNFIVYYDEDGPIAVLDLIKYFPDPDTFYIGLLLIDGKVHRRGYGTSLYRQIENEMMEAGFNRGRLGVLANNLKALSFWDKMGYREIKKLVSTIRPEKNWTVHVMEKKIK